MRKPIVIIGGMGPQASLRFHGLLIEKSKKYHNGNNDEFPHIVHISLPVEDFISDEKAKDKTVAILNELTRTFELLRPSAITLACNTAHILQPSVAFMQQPAFMSMLEIVAANIKSRDIHKIGLLASPTTINTKLYDKVIVKQKVEIVSPGAEQLPILEAAIRRVIAGIEDAEVRSRLTSTAEVLISNGAEAILLGCTELPLLFDKASVQVPVFDCLDIYADAVIDQYYLYNGA